MADIVTTQIFQDGEKGITATKMNNIVALSQIQTAFYNAKPTTSSLDPTDMLLTLKSSGSYAQVSGANVGASIGASAYGDSRLRSYNGIQNPSFEVDQRAVHAGTGFGTGTVTGWVCDRWALAKIAATGTVNAGSSISGGNIVIPGTNFRISNYSGNVQVTATQASLAAGEYLQMYQVIEGSAARELFNDVTSISLLVQCSVAPFKFGVTIKDNPATTSLTKLCTISTANTWTLIQLPNLPKMQGGNFSANPGVPGYTFVICLGAGSTFTTPANDTWQSGNFMGAVGQDSLYSKPVNTSFNVAMVQHEPLATCSQLMDAPFSQEYDKALRFYQKTYNYGTAPATLTTTGALAVNASAGALSVAAPLRFYKPMAKTPTIVGYSPNSATVNQVRDFTASVDRVISGALMTGGDSGFGGWNITTSNASATYYTFHYTADTQW